MADRRPTEVEVRAMEALANRGLTFVRALDVPESCAAIQYRQGVADALAWALGEGPPPQEENLEREAD